MIMGCYGIGVSRVIAAIIEKHHDERGIRWPREVAPFDIEIVPLPAGNEAGEGEIMDLADRYHKDLTKAGYDVLSYIFWDMKHIARTDEFNNMCIARRAEELSEKYPDKKDLFNTCLT